MDKEIIKEIKLKDSKDSKKDKKMKAKEVIKKCEANLEKAGKKLLAYGLDKNEQNLKEFVELSKQTADIFNKAYATAQGKDKKLFYDFLAKCQAEVIKAQALQRALMKEGVNYV